MEARRAEFAQSTMTLVQMNGINEHNFVNMDETEVFFYSNHNCTVNEKGVKTVLITKDALVV